MQIWNNIVIESSDISSLFCNRVERRTRHKCELLQLQVFQVYIVTILSCDCVDIQMEQRTSSWAACLWQKQILPHLSLFCLKASHRYDFLPSVQELKMRISKLGVRESCQSLTLDSHLLSSWTCEYWIWFIWPCYTSTLFCHLYYLFILLSTIFSLSNIFSLYLIIQCLLLLTFLSQPRV